MINKTQIALLSALVLSLVLPIAASAEVSILNRTGDIKITMPDGRQVTVGPTEALPAIPDNATVTVVSGSADISASDASQVQVVCGGYSTTITAANAVNVSVDPAADQISMTLIYGTVEVKGPDGNVTVLDINTPSVTESLSGQQKDAGTQELPGEDEIKQEEQGNSHDISPSA